MNLSVERYRIFRSVCSLNDCFECLPNCKEEGIYKTNNTTKFASAESEGNQFNKLYINEI